MDYEPIYEIEASGYYIKVRTGADYVPYIQSCEKRGDVQLPLAVTIAAVRAEGIYSNFTVRMHPEMMSPSID